MGSTKYPCASVEIIASGGTISITWFQDHLGTQSYIEISHLKQILHPEDGSLSFQKLTSELELHLYL